MIDVTFIPFGTGGLVKAFADTDSAEVFCLPALSAKTIVMSHLKSPEKSSRKTRVFHARVSKGNANSSMSIDHVKVFSNFLYTRQ